MEIYPGFPGARMIYGHDGQVHGVQTADMGVAKGGERKPKFTLGMALTAEATLLAEGCRGSLSEVRRVVGGALGGICLVRQGQ